MIYNTLFRYLESMELNSMHSNKNDRETLKPITTKWGETFSLGEMTIGISIKSISYSSIE